MVRRRRGVTSVLMMHGRWYSMVCGIMCRGIMRRKLSWSSDSVSDGSRGCSALASRWATHNDPHTATMRHSRVKRRIVNALMMMVGRHEGIHARWHTIWLLLDLRITAEHHRRCYSIRCMGSRSCRWWMRSRRRVSEVSRLRFPHELRAVGGTVSSANCWERQAGKRVGRIFLRICRSTICIAFIVRRRYSCWWDGRARSVIRQLK